MKITKIAHYFGSFFNEKSYVLILRKSELGYILGDFFTNSSGHSASLIKKKNYRPGVDFMELFRLKFADKTLIWSNLSL
jgi:hypothetical protein